MTLTIEMPTIEMPAAVPEAPTIAPWRERAAQAIEKRGWTQGDYKDECGRICLAAAIFEGLGLDVWRSPWSKQAMEAVQEIAKLVAPEEDICDPVACFISMVGRWNDAEGRRVEEVLALLRGR